MLGSLIGQDYSKIIVLAVILLGALSVTLLGSQNPFVQLIGVYR